MAIQRMKSLGSQPSYYEVLWFGYFYFYFWKLLIMLISYCGGIEIVLHLFANASYPIFLVINWSFIWWLGSKRQIQIFPIMIVKTNTILRNFKIKTPTKYIFIFCFHKKSMMKNKHVIKSNVKSGEALSSTLNIFLPAFQVNMVSGLKYKI